MTAPNTNPQHGPTPEQLLALADGELDPRTREQVELWLANHPEAREQVEAERRLLSLYHETAAAEPSPAAWDSTLSAIHSAFPTEKLPVEGRPRVSRPASGWGTRLLLGLLAAAAVFGGVLLARPLWRPLPAQLPSQEEVLRQEGDEPFPVATAQEVNILSVDGRDADAIVLWPPLLGSFDLVEAGDVAGVAVSPHPVHGWLARLEDGPVPMFLAEADEP